VIAGDVAVLESLHFPRTRAENVPDGRASATKGSGPLDLISGSGRSPEKILGKGTEVLWGARNHRNGKVKGWVEAKTLNHMRTAAEMIK
jgi:hypothetical protein